MDTTPAPFITAQPELNVCKICGSAQLQFFAHTATCSDCDVLLNYPYTPPREDDFLARSTLDPTEYEKRQQRVLGWYVRSGERSHHNFTHMAQFALTEEDRQRDITLYLITGGEGPRSHW